MAALGRPTRRGRLPAPVRQPAGASAGGRGRPPARRAGRAVDDRLVRPGQLLARAAAPVAATAACAGFLARAGCPRLPSWRRRLYHAVDLLLPNSNAEADQLVRYFQVPAERIHVVPNGADERFAEADPAPFARRVGTRDFVLSAGRIEPRKNQLGLLRAMRGTKVPDHRAGRRRARLRGVRPEVPPRGRGVRFASSRGWTTTIRCWPPPMPPAAAWCWQAGTRRRAWSALEAGMSGTPLVLPEGGCAREYFGDKAGYVRPNDLAGIRRAVLQPYAAAGARASPEHVRDNFSWAAAAQATSAGYRKVI